MSMKEAKLLKNCGAASVCGGGGVVVWCCVCVGEEGWGYYKII